ncbi:alpha/beta hydrolase [Kordiimonas sp.]|uniref:alpha/beta hydrolase n=1 Tax=Kordiimonas sp. TaxID=1970157 RepID=UPI003A8F13CE
MKQILSLAAAAALLTSACAAAEMQTAPNAQAERPSGAERGNGKMQPREFPTLGMQAFSFKSDFMDRNYDIIVRFPMAYMQDPERKFPTLVMTDGNRFFGGVAASLMAVEAELIEPMIIVAVGTPFEEGPMAYNVRRVYEFSPKNWDLKDEFGQSVASTCKQAGVDLRDCTGGAPKFLKFLSKELLPGLARGMRLDLDNLALGGASAGGYFASWAMFQKESPFKNYIISSPAMAYGDGEIFRLEETYSKKHKSLNAGVYMSSGSLEMTHPYIEGVGQVVSGQAHFGGTLMKRGYEGLTVTSEIHDGLGHIDVIPVTFARGLRELFGKSE